MKHVIVSDHRLYVHNWKALLVVGLFAGSLGMTDIPARAAESLPCDIYASSGTSCVAAHSTTHTLISSYNGPLYQVRRWSDDATTTISPLSTGGYANSSTQDTFCTITEIYDQSGRSNNLTIEGPGSQDAGLCSHPCPFL